MVDNNNCPLFPIEICSAIEGLRGDQRQKILYALLRNDELSFSNLMTETDMGNSLLAKYVGELKDLFLIEQYYEHNKEERSYSFYKITEFAKQIIYALNKVLNPFPEGEYAFIHTHSVIEKQDSNVPFSEETFPDDVREDNVVSSYPPLGQTIIKRRVNTD